MPFHNRLPRYLMLASLLTLAWMVDSWSARSMSSCLAKPVQVHTVGKGPADQGRVSRYNADATAEIQKLAEAFGQQHKVPGLSVAIGHQGQVTFAQGFGFANLESQTAATTGTRFRTASIAKPITAALILKLVDEGKIDLDQSAQTYCPQYPVKRWPVTVRQLLGHLGGVRHYKSADEASSTRHYDSLSQALQVFADDPLRHQPGTAYLYTSFGYNLLGSIAEGAGEQSFMSLLQQHVLDPAGMDRTVVDDTFHVVPDRSAGYILADAQRIQMLGASNSMEPGQVYRSTLHDTSMKIPSGGLLSTPTDLIRFSQALLSDQLFAAELRQQMWTQQKTDDGQGTGYGLGWRVGKQLQQDAVWHTGGQSGTSTVLIIFPDTGESVAVMCNLQSTNVTALALQVARVAQRNKQTLSSSVNQK